MNESCNLELLRGAWAIGVLHSFYNTDRGRAFNHIISIHTLTPARCRLSRNDDP